MAEFLVETYAPRETANAVVAYVEDVARAADQMSEQGTEVRFLRAIFAPEEETCFYHYESPSADAVREAATRARLPLERITEAMSITAPGASVRNPRSDGSAANQQTITTPRRPDVTHDPAHAR
jgi:hypothetical protein